VALLLPDARVVSSGDDVHPTPNSDTIEVFSPPYLFDADGSAADRPAITSAPAAVQYDSLFTVQTSGAATRAVLVAPSATTHAADMSQRLVPLTTTGTILGGGLLVQAPPNAAAPPGYYMLFVLDADGTPSVARFVKLSDDVPPLLAPPPAPPPDQTPPPAQADPPPVSPGEDPGSAEALSLPDRTAPKVTISVPALAVRRLRAGRKVTVRLGVDEPAMVRVALAAGRSASRLVELSKRTLHRTARGRFSLTLHLGPVARRRLTKARRVALVIRASDAAGNRSRREVGLSRR
jgi:hypothetical protein